MDNLWQLSKCGSTWQSSGERAVVVPPAPAPAPVPQVQSQDSSGNSMINPSHYSYPHIMQEACSSTRKMMADPLFASSTNFNLYNPGHSVLGSSFFTLLSGPPSFLQYDSQQVLSSKPSNPSSKVYVHSSSSIVGLTEREVVFGSPELSSQNIDKRFLKSRIDSTPVPIRTLASDGGNTAVCLHDIVQARKVNDPSLELAKAANYHTSHGIEQLNGFSSLKAAPTSSPAPAQSGKLHSSSIPHRLSPLTTGFPRVFCLYASGDLFLSNSGLLGVICSCHGLHMSISKFTEHSGLRDVNPGDAVHMDSGETIAQWRKVYFCKFGIRIPEDECGWNWPEGFSETADLVKSKGKVPKMLRSSELSNSVGPPRAFIASEQPLNNKVFSDNHHSGQKLVNEILCHELERNAHNNRKLPNGFIENSHSNVHAGAANKVMEQPVAGCLSMSKLVGATGNDFQSSRTYIDLISKSKNSFTSLENLQNLRSLTIDSDILKFNNLRDGDTLEKATVSSNIELRLGQPSQQSQILGKSNVPGFNTPCVSRVDHPQEFISSEPPIHNVSSNKITEESRQFVHCAAQAAKSSSTGGQNRLKFSNLDFGAYSTRIALQPKQLKGFMVAGSVKSMPVSHLEKPNDKMQTKGSHSGADDSHVMPKQQYFESRISKLDSMNFGCNADNSTEIKFSVNNLENYKLMDRDKGLGHAAVREHAAEEVELGCHVKFMGPPSSSCGFRKTNCDKSFHLQLSDIPFDGTGARLAFNNPEPISSHELGEHLDHGFLRPDTSQPMAARPPLISEAPSIAFSSMGMNSSPNTTSTMSKEEATRVTHTPSLRQAVKYSNLDHVSSSCGFNKEQNVRGNSLNENLKSSITLPSKSAERRDGHKLTTKYNLPELAMKSIHSGITSWTAGGADNSAMVAVSQEMSFQIRDIRVLSHHLCDPRQTGPPLPRVGICENICSSSGHGKCGQGTSCAYNPDKRSCCVQKNSLTENSNLEAKNSLGTFGEPLQIRASILSASNVDRGCTLLGSKSISSGKIGEPMKPNLKKVEFNAFQWKDVPCKMSGRCNVPCKDQKAKFLDEGTDVKDQTSDVARKCFDQSVQKSDCMKEQVMSNISSKCSAPAITQASVKTSNGDSCTDDAQNTGCAKNFAVDEGSGIQKSWSSDDALDSGSNTRFDGFACKINLKNEALSKAISDRSTGSLIDELRVIDSLRLKKVQNQVHSGFRMHDTTSSMKTFEKDFEAGKRKRETKFKILGTSFPASPVSSISTGSSGQSSQSLEDLPMVVQPSQERSKNCTCSIGHSFKRRRSALPASSSACFKEDVHKLDRSTKELSCKTPRRVYDDCFEIPESSRGKKVRLDLDFSKAKQVSKQEVPCKRITKPVVCGRYGLISNGDTSKPAKILSLAKILKIAKRCTPAGNEVLKKSPAKASKKLIIRKANRRSARISNFKEDKYHVGQGTAVFIDVPMGTLEGTEMACSPRWAKDADVSYMLDKGKELKNERSHGIPDRDLGTRARRKSKEVRKRSLYELITEGKDSGFATISKNFACVPQDNVKNGGDSNNLLGVDNTYRSPEDLRYKSTPDVDAFCHVCGSLNNDEMNCLLECNRCLIKVHQACYGIAKVPKSYWYCRPCRENATNIVCVLCGYEGGVMTRAVQSSNVVRSLLNAWNVVLGSPENPVMPSEVFEFQLNANAPSGNQVDIDAPPNTHMRASSVVDTIVKNSSCPNNDTMVLNSVTAGFLDSTVKQWIHMVCGLWTPGTRCPNVDTMSAFDVSGACHPKGNVVCSMCKRPGGCCIRCRVMDCTIHFHPWCAHQKGLLQSEVEGADNDKVGFYGRCELHATEDHYDHNTNSCSIQNICTHETETCARTEGYKGRKQEGFRHDSRQLSGSAGGCLFRQEQVDAWNHINRQMSFTRWLQKPPLQPAQDIEYDFRKEYARYKQLKGWKHLVVYKSGIHALGLYTSLFISQGAMVVEYVGEIVGLRVADRRESEYQSGKQLQYKSACYFFRIDKEHIIDATRKGGIARFVNHSCQPNCVAKVITVRGEKKVVFFAERDIYPGEEITYDYHFNNEDEVSCVRLQCLQSYHLFLIFIWNHGKVGRSERSQQIFRPIASFF